MIWIKAVKRALGYPYTHTLPGERTYFGVLILLSQRRDLASAAHGHKARDKQFVVFSRVIIVADVVITKPAASDLRLA